MASELNQAAETKNVNKPMGVGALSPTPSVFHNPRRDRRRNRIDSFIKYFVSLGGILVIASILAILVVIAIETVPLFFPPALEKVANYTVGKDSKVLAVGCDEYREIGYAVTPKGLTYFNLMDGTPLDTDAGLDLGGAEIIKVASGPKGAMAVVLSDARIIFCNVGFRVTFPDGVDGERLIKPVVTSKDPIQLTGASSKNTIAALGYRDTDDGEVGVVALANNDLYLFRQAESEGGGLFADEVEETTYKQTRLPIKVEGDITDLAVTESAHFAIIGTSKGELIAVPLRDPESGKISSIATLPDSSKVTTLCTLLGGATTVVGAESGNLTSWQLIRDKDNEYKLTQIHSFARHEAPVVAISPSARNKGFVTLDNAGHVGLHFQTSGKTLMMFKTGDDESNAVALSPKSDGILASSSAGSFHNWLLDNPHPESTVSTLFASTWYEGYPEPDHTWQSSSGSDEFEPKFGLMPLIVGTLKGTFYALVFAIPLGLLSALYVSQFMSPRLRQFIKPSVEVMAAMPSVVLGFLAGLWLAPVVEDIAPGIFMGIAVAPATILIFLVIWEIMPDSVRAKVRPGYEIFLLIPVVVFGVYAAIKLGDVMNATFMGGDYQKHLLEVWGVKFDQRNSLVVGLAMGVAVIPIIFTIAEDSLSNVPQHLRAGSLALGSTPWQAAVRVILPTASPGIFSAVMIGFGRAVGETMIVLMATGNTPVMDFSMFSGFRALSANIAVELPEAPEGGTHYRILFLAALILFFMTFSVNTMAEVVRLRLRKKYRVL